MNYYEALIALKSNEAFKVVAQELERRRQNALSHLIGADATSFAKFQGGFIAMDELISDIANADAIVKQVADNVPTRNARAS